MWLQNEIRNDYADCSSLLLSFLWINFEYLFFGGGEDPYLKVNLCQILCQPNQSWYRLYFLSNSLLDESISDSISHPRHLAAKVKTKNRCAAPLCWKRNTHQPSWMNWMKPPRMRIVCPIPCSTVPPAEGARARGDAEGGRVAQDGRRRRVRRRQVRPLPALPLGPPRKADHLHRRQGK